jgi:hypothetical protein
MAPPGSTEQASLPLLFKTYASLDCVFIITLLKMHFSKFASSGNLYTSQKAIPGIMRICGKLLLSGSNRPKLIWRLPGIACRVGLFSGSAEWRKSPEGLPLR